MQRLVINHTRPEINESVFKSGDWTEFYGDVVEEDPPHMPIPLGESVMMSCFIDADHAGNKVTRRSHTGICILVNNAPITVYSKRQNTCESSTHGSELVAMRLARDLISAPLRIKLKCFGVPIWSHKCFLRQCSCREQRQFTRIDIDKETQRYKLPHCEGSCCSENYESWKRRHANEYCGCFYKVSTIYTEA